MNNENHETISDIVTKMRKRAEEVYAGQDGYPESWKNQMDYWEIYELADRIESANKREYEAGAKVTTNTFVENNISELLRIARENEKSGRNCDRYMTWDSAYDGFLKFCNKTKCSNCRFHELGPKVNCVLAWLFSEAKEE